MNVKYPDEVRLCLGVGLVRNPDYVETGVALEPFVYSGKTILSVKDYNAKIDLEIERVRKLTGGKQAGWIVTMREAGVLYRNDPLTAINGLGPKTVAKLRERGGIFILLGIYCST